MPRSHIQSRKADFTSFSSILQKLKKKKEKNFTLAIKPKISTHAVLVVYTVWKNEKFTCIKKYFGKPGYAAY